MTPADVSFANLILWIAAIGTILSVATAIWTIFSGPSKKNGERIAAVTLRLDDHGLRLSAVEQAQKSLPKTSDMHELELAMTRLQGEIKTMSAVMTGQSQIMERLEAIVGRHENHLLDGSGRK